MLNNNFLIDWHNDDVDMSDIKWWFLVYSYVKWSYYNKKSLLFSMNWIKIVSSYVEDDWERRWVYQVKKYSKISMDVKISPENVKWNLRGWTIKVQDCCCDIKWWVILSKLNINYKRRNFRGCMIYFRVILTWFMSVIIMIV